MPSRKAIRRNRNRQCRIAMSHGANAHAGTSGGGFEAQYAVLRAGFEAQANPASAKRVYFVRHGHSLYNEWRDHSLQPWRCCTGVSTSSLQFQDWACWHRCHRHTWQPAGRHCRPLPLAAAICHRPCPRGMVPKLGQGSQQEEEPGPCDGAPYAVLLLCHPAQRSASATRCCSTRHCRAPARRSWSACALASSERAWTARCSSS